MVGRFLKVRIALLVLLSLPGTAASQTQIPDSLEKPALCRNEPFGLHALTSQSWSTLPPRAGSRKLDGWRITHGVGRLDLYSDDFAPLSPPSVLRGKFPQGMPGGGGPFHVGIRIDPVRTLYQCFAIRISPGFTNNRNVGTKLAFILNPTAGGRGSSQAYINLFGGQSDVGTMGVNIEGQGGHINRNMRTRFAWSRAAPGWHIFEVLMIANSPSRGDGVMKFWVDGKLDTWHTDVTWFNAGTFPPGFNQVDITPTYGGGLKPVPRDQFIYVDHWYISGQ